MPILTSALNDGIVMPLFGLGVFQTPPVETKAAMACQYHRNQDADQRTRIEGLPLSQPARGQP